MPVSSSVAGRFHGCRRRGFTAGRQPVQSRYAGAKEVGALSETVFVITGLAREARIATGQHIVAIRSGGDPQRLREKLAALDGRPLRAVISFGLAGGLDPSLPRGTVIVGTEVVGPARTIAAAPKLARAMQSDLRLAGATSVLASVAGSEALAADAPAKAALRSATGAAAVDMESHVAAEFAAAHGLPFGVLRVICDPASRGLPKLALRALKPDGKIDLITVRREIANDWAQLPDLFRAACDSEIAFAALRRCRRVLGNGFGLARAS